MSNDRVLPLEGVHNFRDYGGYPSSHGGQVVRNVLWRSAQHGDATDADLARIKDLALNTVIDLRGTSEREAKPCRRYPGFAAEVLHHHGETAGLGLHMEAAESALSAAEARAAMMRLYEGIAWRDNLTPILKRYFDVLEQREGASLVHCVAGKDRTGFAVALLQHVLGVHADDILADYELTNLAGNIEGRIAAGASQIRERYGNIDDDTIRVLMGVDPEYIATTFAKIRERHGDIDSYLADWLGVDAGRQDKLRARYLTA
ncbi:tyrosine-protein phosphatase [Novosphingobium sp.]|uniref:tyrosine-protein phosphatase n=1 Tax=Novosphingobium sp. TaxID=1874826 RepID=UPI0035ADCD81